VVLCEEAIRLARLPLRLFPSEPDHGAQLGDTDFIVIVLVPLLFIMGIVFRILL
jgi:hypothetical protein